MPTPLVVDNHVIVGVGNKTFVSFAGPGLPDGMALSL